MRGKALREPTRSGLESDTTGTQGLKNLQISFVDAEFPHYPHKLIEIRDDSAKLSQIPLPLPSPYGYGLMYLFN